MELDTLIETIETFSRDPDDHNQLMSFLVDYNNDLHVYEFASRIKELVLEDKPQELEAHLKESIPMHVHSRQVSCVLAIRDTCQNLMIYAAMRGQADIVEVFSKAQFLPEVTIDQDISDEYIQAANDILSRPSQLRR